VEYIPQLDPITSSRLRIHDGQAMPPAEPGLGIEWDWSSIAQRSIATLEVK
jgi:L-alanine-DL-glutamate epimerase-like enolase superfamily enzyme